VAAIRPAAEGPTTHMLDRLLVQTGQTGAMATVWARCGDVLVVARHAIILARVAFGGFRAGPGGPTSQKKTCPHDRTKATRGAELEKTVGGRAWPAVGVMEDVQNPPGTTRMWPPNHSEKGPQISWSNRFTRQGRPKSFRRRRAGDPASNAHGTEPRARAPNRTMCGTRGKRARSVGLREIPGPATRTWGTPTTSAHRAASGARFLSIRVEPAEEITRALPETAFHSRGQRAGHRPPGLNHGGTGQIRASVWLRPRRPHKLGPVKGPTRTQGRK